MDEHDETHHQASPGTTPGEGIRIIGADEAAAALESGKAFGRHGEGGPQDTDVADSDHPSFQRFPRPSSADPARWGGSRPDPAAGSASSWAADGVEPGDDIDLTQPLLATTPPGADAGEPSAAEPARVRSRADRAAARTSVRELFRRGGRAQASSRPRSGTGGTGGADDGEEVRTESFVMAGDVGRGPGDGGDLGEREGSRSRPADWGGGPGDDSPGDQPSHLADFADSAADTGPFRSERPSPPPRGGRRQAPRFTPPRLRRPANDLTTRVLTGLGIGIVAAILFKLGSVTSLAMVVLLVTLAAAELFGVLRRAGYRPATLVGLVATVGIVIGAYVKGEAAIPLVVALVVVFTLLWYLLGVVRARPTVNVAVTLLGFLWVGLLGSFAALLLDPRIFPNRHGVALLLGATVATVGYDIGSFLVGGRFGRHLLAPAISPHKTWEGLIGGTVASVLVGAVVVSQISPWTTARGVALGLVVAVAAPLGDLCESLLKRDMGIKDMGAILPGHGGILDRADALLFVIPATYYLVRLINFGG